MRQEHKLVFWSYANNDSFDEAAEKAYKVMECLMTNGDYFYPKYQVKKKKNTEPFNWNLNNFKEALRKGSNRQGKVEFLDLGYSIAFISSWQEKETTLIKMTVGVQHPRFSNRLIIHLSSAFTLDQERQIEQLQSVFKQCIEVFQPKWAAIINQSNQVREELKEVQLDNLIHWMNYWGPTRVEEIGDEKIEAAPVFYTEKIHSGYLLQLQEKPLDNESEEDLDRQRTANLYFDFKKNID